jgi:hypothetical protein
VLKNAQADEKQPYQSIAPDHNDSLPAFFRFKFHNEKVFMAKKE